MKNLTEMTKKGDPMLRINLSENIIQKLQEGAHINRRRLQDQVIKSIAKTFRNADIYSATIAKIAPTLIETLEAQARINPLKKYAQVIPQEIMTALKESAHERGVNLECEVSLRLLAEIAISEMSGNGLAFNTIMRKKFTFKEAVAECKRKREAALFRYEMKRLKLFLECEESLPRDYKENFSVIDFKTTSKKMREALQSKKKQDNRE